MHPPSKTEGEPNGNKKYSSNMIKYPGGQAKSKSQAGKTQNKNDFPSTQNYCKPFRCLKKSRFISEKLGR